MFLSFELFGCVKIAQPNYMTELNIYHYQSIFMEDVQDIHLI